MSWSQYIPVMFADLPPSSKLIWGSWVACTTARPTRRPKPAFLKPQGPKDAFRVQVSDINCRRALGEFHRAFGSKTCEDYSKHMLKCQMGMDPRMAQRFVLIYSGHIPAPLRPWSRRESNWWRIPRSVPWQRKNLRKVCHIGSKLAPKMEIWWNMMKYDEIWTFVELFRRRILTHDELQFAGVLRFYKLIWNLDSISTHSHNGWWLFTDLPNSRESQLPCGAFICRVCIVGWQFAPGVAPKNMTATVNMAGLGPDRTQKNYLTQ